MIPGTENKFKRESLLAPEVVRRLWWLTAGVRVLVAVCCVLFAYQIIACAFQ